MPLPPRPTSRGDHRRYRRARVRVSARRLTEPAVSSGRRTAARRPAPPSMMIRPAADTMHPFLSGTCPGHESDIAAPVRYQRAEAGKRLTFPARKILGAAAALHISAVFPGSSSVGTRTPPEVIMTVTTTRASDSSPNEGKLAGRRWTERAACHAPEVNPELFFPVSAHGPSLTQVTAAKGICASCPVTASCLASALRSGEAAGIWGGTTPEERRTLRARLRRSAVTAA